jgi:hypothetical protein
MAYNPSNPPLLLAQGVARGSNSDARVWQYTSTDSALVASGVGYFTNGYALGIRSGDVIRVTDSDGVTGSELPVTAASAAGGVTTQDNNASAAGLTKGYNNNVSNATNTTSATAATAITLPLIGNGSNNFEYDTNDTGKLEFDATFNSNKGGIITDNLRRDTTFFARITLVNLGGSSGFTIQCFLVFDKTIPGTGVAISSSQVTLSSSQEAAPLIKFFGNNIEAIYPRVIASATRDVRINGFDITAFENQ